MNKVTNPKYPTSSITGGSKVAEILGGVYEGDLVYWSDHYNEEISRGLYLVIEDWSETSLIGENLRTGNRAEIPLREIWGVIGGPFAKIQHLLQTGETHGKDVYRGHSRRNWR